jgi:hypothetical protein
MKGESKKRVRIEKGLFERRKAERQRARDEDQRALESRKASRDDLQREDAHFVGMKVRLEFARTTALW